MSNKISVITVVYNDVANIRATMESFFSQTWEDKEYIVIDGGSTDGTADIIKEYAPRLAYWCSEKDNGIYDAMNKGIMHATGAWINILNSGDLYNSNDVFESIFGNEIEQYDVIYGDSIEVSNNNMKLIKANSNTSLLSKSPLFRHGSSIIKAKLHKQHLYPTELTSKLGYALDWKLLFDLYDSGYKFHKVNVIFERYLKDGVSNYQIKNLWYNYLITSKGNISINKLYFLLKAIAFTSLKHSIVYRYTRAFFLEFLVNDVLPTIPFWNIRKVYLKALGMKIGNGSFIMKKNYFINGNLIQIGTDSHINRDCILDARGRIQIGNSVSISHRVSLLTGSHEINSTSFQGSFKPIHIDDYVWIGANATILQGINIGKGAVVCAGAVVTKDVDKYQVVAGIPAKQINTRNKKLKYECHWNTPLT